MKKNKEASERRLKYERAVALACEVCKEDIEDARKVFLEAKRAARRGRDEAIAKAKAEYEGGTNE